jgi:hypothetical protein
MVKLTVAPTAANTTVLTISSERILGNMLNTVPEMVPALSDTFVSTLQKIKIEMFPIWLKDAFCHYISQSWQN